MTVQLVSSIKNFVGLSTDTKPTSAPVMSTFKESDTSSEYICYDGTNWTPREKVNRYRVMNPYHWLGQPATAYNVIPSSAGVTVVPGKSRFMRAYIQNRSADTVSACIAGFFSDTEWIAGQWTDATTTQTDDTTDAQDAGTNDFPINTTTISDGHIIGCTYPFGIVSYDMTTATIGAALEGVIEYWNGTAWTAIPAVGMGVDIPRVAGVQWATGELIIMFDPPIDWALGGTGTNVSATRYNLRYRSSAAGTTAGLARRIYVGVPLSMWISLATNTEASVRDYSPYGLCIPDGVVRIGVAANLAVGTVSTVVSTSCELIY